MSRLTAAVLGSSFLVLRFQTPALYTAGFFVSTEFLASWRELLSGFVNPSC